MDDISTVALFSDIREEKGNTATIVGVMPDTLNVSKFPGTLPKLCIYVRIHVGVDFDPGAIFTRIVLNGAEISRSGIQTELFKKSKDKAKTNGKGYVGLISTFVLTPFGVTQEGRLEALVTAAGKEYVAGSLDLRHVQSSPT
jgi:hypothetical protein